MIEYPVYDPETGEVLAEGPEEVREVCRLLAEVLVKATQERERATREAAEARRRLGLLMEPGDALAAPDGWAVAVKPGAPPRRALNRQAIQSHQEALAPLGLGITERLVQEFPKVSDLTTTRARVALARQGLTPETFLLAGEPGQPEVVLVAPEEVR